MPAASAWLCSLNSLLFEVANSKRNYMDSKSAELTSFPFKYCSNLTEGEITAIALARGITAGVCAVTSFIALVILALMNCYRHRVYETVVKRLVAGYIAVNLPYQLVLALHLIHYFRPDQKNFCKADGFLNQYLESVEFLFMLAIGLVLFLKLCGVTTSWKCHCCVATFKCCGRKINKLETGLFVSMFLFPLLFDWIPFTTGSYGSFGPWCWIRSLENDCSPHKAGLRERKGVAYAPLGTIVVLTIGLFIASLFLLGCTIKKAKKLNKMRITNSVFFLALMLLLYIVQAVVYFTLSVPAWMLIAIFIPLTETLTPLVLLVAIHLPLSSVFGRVCCHGHGYMRTESDQATMRASTVIQQPSHTTWNPPHSTYTDSQTLLANEKQPQKYSGIV